MTEENHRFFLGIDPGKKGAAALLREDGSLVTALPFSEGNFLGLVDLILSLPDGPESVRCCLEKVHAMPKQGSVSMFSFGRSVGWITGVLDLAGIPYQEIPPQTWKREFGLNSDKQKSVDVCHRLFPSAPLVPPGCRVPQDGMAEALLMAEFARRKL